MQIWNQARRNHRVPSLEQNQHQDQQLQAPTPTLPPKSNAPSLRSPSILANSTSPPSPPKRPRPTENVRRRASDRHSTHTEQADTKIAAESASAVSQSLTVLKKLLNSETAYINVEDFGSRRPSSSSSPSPDLDLRNLISLADDPKFSDQIASAIGEGVDIFAYLASLEKHTHEEEKEQKRVVEYKEEIERFKDLHASIQKCDSVLASVEDYLSHFQHDLGLISSEIETLQNRSIFLNRRLENRKELESRLSGLIEDLFIPPYVIHNIVEGEIGSQWISTIEILSTRLKRMELFKSEVQNINASVALINEIEPVLRMLADKAVERIRDFFVEKIKSLRAANVNAQVILYSVFLKFRQLYAFLAYVNRQLADDIAHGYANTMRWYYHSNFSRYLKALEKLKIQSLDRSVLLGSTEPSRILSSSRTPYANATRDPLILGRRINIVFSTDSSVMMESTAEQDNDVQWMEIGFRSFNLALMDNACAEYLFIVDFFNFKSPDIQSQLFQDIFQPTFELGEHYIQKLLDITSFDAFGALLCIRIIQLLTFELQRRKVPVMEAYCNRLKMILWPRFQLIMDAHSDNLRKLSGRSAPHGDESKGLVGAASVTSSAISGLSSILSSSHISSALPHPVAQKFANFLNGILELSPEDMEREPVSISIVRLRNEFEAFLTKISSKITAGGGGTTQQQRQQNSTLRERFLYNNYMLVYTIISDAEGKLADQERTHFKNLTDAYAGAAA
ncbi:Sac2 family-domain-containing protein [Lipomyces doorenjongii]|uniref:Sac2 family-domain-containing protein n=1 Tax=Lipomyces doorenjongii TaxID=383834 RepID=UPI0034CE00D7